MTALRRPLVLLGALVVAIATSVAAPPPAAAHPLGNFTVNRALAIRISDVVDVTAVLDLAEIPAYETIREVDTDADDAVTPAEGDPWAADTCAAWRGRIDVAIDGRPAALQMSSAAELTFPSGAGGLPTLRLVCHWELPPSDAGPHRLTLQDTNVDDRIGWREVTATASGEATISASDVPSESDSGFLTRYPEDRLASPPEVRSANLTFTPGSGAESGGAAPDPIAGGRGTAGDPLAALVGGELSPLVVLLALLLSAGLGAAHALSPGHGKTLVAAYVLGAGGTARAAVQIGLWVAISHTAGVLVLGIVTLGASEWLLPEQLIAWLSLGSGVIVTGLGLVLLVRVLAAARRRRIAAVAGEAHGDHPAHPHPHPHPHAHGRGHGHDHDHPHTHEVPAPGELSWRTAIALGFAGGAVPSASALIVLLVAISTDRLVLGIVLIGAFGIGMAAVLGGLAFAIARMRHLAAGGSFLASRPIVGRLAAMAPVAAGLVVLATGVAFTAVAVGRLA